MHYITFLVVIALSGCASKPVEPTQTSGNLNEPTQPLTPGAKSNATAPSKDDAMNATITCTQGEDVRILRNVTDGGKCELRYTKFGNESVAASAAFDLAHCDRVKTRIADNLGKAGFKCK